MTNQKKNLKTSPGEKHRDIKNFWVIGINYKTADAGLRGLFAVNSQQYGQLLAAAPSYGFGEFFVLSTCNRTEIYGFAGAAGRLAEFLCGACAGTAAVFGRSSYCYNGNAAIAHLYSVAAGLDSQILGENEIFGQIKSAVKRARTAGFIGPFLDKLVSSVTRAAKNIKKNTALNSGAISVPFAAAVCLKERVINFRDKKVVLVGTGKIGKETSKNIVGQLGIKNLVLINRTDSAATSLAKKLGALSAPYKKLAEQIYDADIILLATSSPKPLVLKKHLQRKGKKIIIDMSVPSGVEREARNLPGVSFVDVDMLSKINDKTLQNRRAEVPKATGIINKYVAEFKSWHNSTVLGHKKTAAILQTIYGAQLLKKQTTV